MFIDFGLQMKSPMDKNKKCNNLDETFPHKLAEELTEYINKRLENSLEWECDNFVLHLATESIKESIQEFFYS